MRKSCQCIVPEKRAEPAKLGHSIPSVKQTPNCFRAVHELNGLFNLKICLSRGTQRGYSSKPVNIAFLNVF